MKHAEPQDAGRTATEEIDDTKIKPTIKLGVEDVSRLVGMSKETEREWLALQEYWRGEDHRVWSELQAKQNAEYSAHIGRTNRHNMVNSVAQIVALAIVVFVLIANT